MIIGVPLKYVKVSRPLSNYGREKISGELPPF
jgi:hypothetical protein